MKKLLLFAVLLAFNTHASSLQEFNKGLKEAFYFKRIDRANLLSEKVRVTKFNRLARVLSPNATATYNDKTNTISLDESLLRKSGSKYFIINAKEILQPNYVGFSPVTTIFHELAHAELDIFVENEKELTDLALKHFYKTKLSPLYRKYFKGMNPWTVFHEHFAYYRTELLETLSLDIMDIHMENGWVASSNRCYLTPELKKRLASGVSLEEFLELRTQKNRAYKTVSPSYVYVKGKDLNLDQLADYDLKIIKEAHQLFWSYHLEFYNVPMNTSELTQKMNLDKAYENLKQCRAQYY